MRRTAQGAENAMRRKFEKHDEGWIAHSFNPIRLYRDRPREGLRRFGHGTSVYFQRAYYVAENVNEYDIMRNDTRAELRWWLAYI